VSDPRNRYTFAPQARMGRVDLAVIPLPPWQNDWLYALVLREAEADWEWCNLLPDRDVWRYVLIEEWSSAHGSMCEGKLVRAWVRDSDGLRQISLNEHKRHKRRIRGRIFPFVMMMFHIQPDRTRVVLGHRQANTAGTGCRYLVQGEGVEAKLEFDPSGGGWIS
jgi:hypothetical protein